MADLFPVGSVVQFGGTVAPSNWLFCNGDAISRTTYAALFTAISTAFGVGDGSTTFNIPDTRGRIPIGAGTGSGLTARTLADEVGTETHQLTTAQLPAHTHTQDSHTHTQDSHSHGYTDSGHSHGIEGAIDLGSVSPDSATIGSTGTSSASASAGLSLANGTATNQAATAANNTAGSDGAHANVQPCLVLNFIIRY